MTRLLSGVALAALAIAAVWLAPDLLFQAVATALLALAMMECAALARANGSKISTWAVLIATLPVFAIISLPSASHALDGVLMAALVGLAIVSLVQWQGGPDALAIVSASLFPVLYLGLPIGALVAIRRLAGPGGLFLLMLTVVVSDTAQYYTGRLLGRHLLAPVASPKKTIEGAIGGFVFGVPLFAVAGAWWLPSLAVALRVGLGAAIVALGIAGDLFESMLKRSAGVKDSSTLIPGHGGVLDRIDALLFAAPVYYIVLKYV